MSISTLNETSTLKQKHEKNFHSDNNLLHFSLNKKQMSDTALLYTFLSGLINIGAFLACHRFVTHVTGFATHFGADLAQFKWSEALSMLIAPLFFLFGAALSGFFIQHQKLLGKKIQLGAIFVTLSLSHWSVVILSQFQIFGEFGLAHEARADFLFISILCLNAGLQNATFSSLSQNFWRTTHLTGLTTDLGINITQALFHRQNPELTQLMKLRSKIILSFILGSVMGALIFSKFHYLGFIIPAIVNTFFYFKIRKDSLKL